MELMSEMPTKNEEGNESPAFEVLYNLSPSELEDIKDQFLRRLKGAEDNMKSLYPSMIANYKKYCSVADPIVDDLGNEVLDKPNLFIPYPFAIVESEMPRLAGRLPRARAFPLRHVDDKKVKCIQDLIYYALDRMNFIKLQTLWMRQYAIYGWSPLYFYWRDETSKVLSREKLEIPGLGEAAYVLKRVDKKKYDDFWASVLDVFDCFFQPGVEEIEEGDFFFFREWLSKKDLQKLVKAGILYPEVEEYLISQQSPNYRLTEGEGRRERDDIKGLVPTSSSQNDTYGKYELMWCLESGRIIQVLDRQIVARVGDNPNPLQEIPIINCNLTPLVNEPIGVGTIESLAGLPDKLNALSNGRLENISLLLGQVFLANRSDQQTDFKNLQFRAGNVILTGDVNNSIKPLSIPDLGQNAEREIQTTKSDLQFVSGISDYLVGTKSSSKLVDTATGVSTIVREANAKFALKLSAFESGSLRKLIEVCHAYQMVYMPNEKRIHVLGPKGYEVLDITIDDILVECDFIVEPGSSIPLDQLTRRESLTSLLDRVSRMPQLVRMDKFLKEVFEAYDIRNVEDLLVTQDAPLSASEDVKLAEAENMALAQAMDIQLMGNHGLHLGIHGPVSTSGWSPEGIEKHAAHVLDHQNALQAEIAAQQQQQQAALQAAMGGGQNALPNTPGAGPGAGNRPPGPPMGLPSPLPQGQGQIPGSPGM